MCIFTDATSNEGYQRLKGNVAADMVDDHEGFDFYAPVKKPDKNKPLWGENQWPTGNEVWGFEEKYTQWVDKMKDLGMIVKEAYVHMSGYVSIGLVNTLPSYRMSAGLGMTKEEWDDLKGKVDNSFWAMRITGDGSDARVYIIYVYIHS